MADIAVETSASTGDALKPTADDKVLAEARDRFSFCEDWESEARQRAIEDDKFGHADSDNQYQWPDQLLTDRELQQRPTLTVNKTRVHCLQIINDGKQNKPGIIVHPTSNEATYEAAEVLEDVIRHIEYRSRAQEAYDHALDRAVFTGYGVCKVVSAYLSAPTLKGDTAITSSAWDQELLVKPVRDPLTIYIDPDAKEADKSDMEFAFEFDDMPRDKFEREYPEFKDVSPTTFGNQTSFDSWVSDQHVRVALYWRKKHSKKTIVSVVDPNTGERITREKKEVPAEVLKMARENEDAQYRERDADVVTVECFKIAGTKVIDHYTWPGKYIPIAVMVGEETVIDGQMDRKGHVRYLKDPQRIYNYQTSAEVEFGALQTKTPWIGPAETFESYEEYYAQANIQNVAFLPYKQYTDEGERELNAPTRIDPPRSSDAFIKGMAVAENEMMMASGQYQAQMGENENAKSGKAIAERQRQGDNATYHFIDNQAIMVRQLGRILVDAIPFFYDTRRVMRIRGDDGIMRSITIDPQALEAVQKQEDVAKREASIIFNPNVGEYAVEADIGPSYATKRQEAWNAIVQILSQDKTLAPLIGDLLFQNGDFPGADEIAKRLRRMVPVQALTDEPSPVDQQMQQQIQQLTGLVQQLNQKLGDKSAEINIKGFDAETKRLVAVGNAGPIVTPEQAQPLIAQTEEQMLQGGVPAEFGTPQQGLPAPMAQQGMPQ